MINALRGVKSAFCVVKPVVKEVVIRSYYSFGFVCSKMKNRGMKLNLKHIFWLIVFTILAGAAHGAAIS